MIPKTCSICTSKYVVLVGGCSMFRVCRSHLPQTCTFHTRYTVLVARTSEALSCQRLSLKDTLHVKLGAHNVQMRPFKDHLSGRQNARLLGDSAHDGRVRPPNFPTLSVPLTAAPIAAQSASEGKASRLVASGLHYEAGDYGDWRRLKAVLRASGAARGGGQARTGPD